MKLLLASHGNLSTGIKSSLEIIVGANIEVDAIAAYLDEVTLEQQISEYITQTEVMPDLILTDLYAGSVNQKISAHEGFANIPVVSGMNLPLALQAVLMDVANFDEAALKDLIEVSQNEIKRTQIVTDEDDFDF